MLELTTSYVRSQNSLILTLELEVDNGARDLGVGPNGKLGTLKTGHFNACILLEFPLTLKIDIIRYVGSF
jgi:hypothetical protein